MFKTAVPYGLIGLLITAVAHGQPVPSRAPSSTHIYPAGGRRGEVVRVGVGAECLPPGAEFFVFAEGVEATRLLDKRLANLAAPSPRRPPTEVPISYPKQWEAQLTIAPDAPLGRLDWRVACAQGGTVCRPFIVGDLPEYLEREANTPTETAELVTVPTTINGQICGERDIDSFRCIFTKGDTAVVDVFAARIASRLDPIVEILGPDGSRPPITTHYLGSDPVLAFPVQQTGEHLVRVSNVSFHGSPAHVYRINLTTKPYVHWVLPAGGTTGSVTEVTMRCLGSGRRIRQRVHVPETPGPFRFRGDTLAAPITLFADAGNVRGEQEPNGSDAPQAVRFGETVYGTLAAPMDEDWYLVRVGKHTRLELTCRAFPPGSAALPVLTLYSSNGKRIKTARSVEASDGVCRLGTATSGAAEYLACVRDLRQGALGSDQFLYRLTAASPSPDFSVSVESDVVNVPQGGRVELKVQVNRQGGFSGAVTLEVEGLPDHVQAKPARIDGGKSAGQLVLSASDHAPAVSSRI